MYCRMEYPEIAYPSCRLVDEPLNVNNVINLWLNKNGIEICLTLPRVSLMQAQLGTQVAWSQVSEATVVVMVEVTLISTEAKSIAKPPAAGKIVTLSTQSGKTNELRFDVLFPLLKARNVFYLRACEVETWLLTHNPCTNIHLSDGFFAGLLRTR